MDDKTMEARPSDLPALLRKLADRLSQDGNKILSDVGSDFVARWAPVIQLLQRHGPSSVTDLASRAGVSHPLVNRVAEELIAAGFVAPYRDRRDKRRRVLALTTAGRTIAETYRPVREALDAAYRDLLGDNPLVAELTRLADSLAAKSLRERFMEQSTVVIERWAERYADDFRRLNEAWIKAFFTLEPSDTRVLEDPKGKIIDAGGEIFFALDAASGEVLGTCALLHKDAERCELAKMAVDPAAQGRKIGQRLGVAFLDYARDAGYQVAFLETNAVLAPALAVYDRLGFVRLPFPYDSDYARADVYMEAALT